MDGEEKQKFDIERFQSLQAIEEIVHGILHDKLHIDEIRHDTDELRKRIESVEMRIHRHAKVLARMMVELD